MRKKKLGKAKQDVQERHSKGISESEMVVVGEGGGDGGWGEVQAKRSSS